MMVREVGIYPFGFESVIQVGSTNEEVNPCLGERLQKRVACLLCYAVETHAKTKLLCDTPRSTPWGCNGFAESM
jgi:hypothetical protein